MRLFAGDRIYNIMNRFKLPEDQPMEARILSSRSRRAEEGRGAELRVRKNILKYDDVMNSSAR